MIPSLINLFASIVRFDALQKQKSSDYVSHSLPVLDVLPSLFVEFANKSRVSSGFRLLKRCLRHALDPKCIPLDNTKAYLFETDTDSELGMVLSNSIPASMKDSYYNSTIAFTATKLLSTKCNCPAGGHNANSRVVCVHNLPLMYQMVLLLDDGLAEHFLVEVCIKDLLDSIYATGTQRSKKKLTTPSVKLLRPIRDVNFGSDYYEIYTSMKAVGYDPANSECTGYL